jgi:serine O-acetyltransferase
MRQLAWQEVLDLDLVAQGLPGKWRWRYVITERIAWFTRRLRIAESHRDNRGVCRLVYLFHRLWLDRVSERLSFDIPLGVFAPGMSIAHRGTIIVNGNAVVGKNCRIHPGVTIGASHGKSPRIGQDVFVGPNALIIGGIVIGDGVVIGPGALVNFDVAAGAICLAPRALVKQTTRPAWTSPQSDLGLKGSNRGE